ncbi:MAG: motility associated factor glycosyltransferase family protein [Synergistetes bacterium]|nr:motility associated factor glycosyltransferase family protein [Synergistota bacterium]
MDLLSLNLQAIKHRNRELFQKLRKVPPAPYVSFSPSKKGPLVAYVLAKDGKRYLLHSAHDPIAEAEDVASKVRWRGVTHVVVFGLGCGYQLPSILKRVSPKVKVYAIEPDISLFKAVLAVVNWKSFLSYPNLNLIVGLNPSAAVEAIMKTLNPVELKALEIFRHPVYYRLLPTYFSELEKELNESIRISLVNLITALQTSFRDQKNTLLNLRYVVFNPPVKNIFRAFTGKPAIIVCAGPSLDKNVHYLADVQDKALIISVDTALRPLIVRGIHPHIVVAGDPQDANFDHFRMVKPSEMEGIYLVAEPRVSPLIFNYWRGRIFICDFGSQIMRWLRSFYGEFGKLTVWGSVSTVAVSLAVELGCRPIILLGQDLAYTGLKRYASYTWVDETSPNDVDPGRFNLIREKDIWGRETYTARNMLSYRDWLKQFFKKVRGVFINATEGGILREGADIKSFVEVSHTLLKGTFKPLEILGKNWRNRKSPERLSKEMEEKLSSLMAVMKEVIELCSDKISILEKSCGKINEEVREGEDRLKALFKRYPFIEEGFLPYILAFNRGIERLRDLPEEEAEKKEFEAYALLFTGVRDMATKYVETIDEAMRKLKGGKAS